MLLEKGNCIKVQIRRLRIKRLDQWCNPMGYEIIMRLRVVLTLIIFKPTVHISVSQPHSKWTVAKLGANEVLINC